MHGRVNCWTYRPPTMSGGAADETLKSNGALSVMLFDMVHVTVHAARVRHLLCLTVSAPPASDGSGAESGARCNSHCCGPVASGSVPSAVVASAPPRCDPHLRPHSGVKRMPMAP